MRHIRRVRIRRDRPLRRELLMLLPLSMSMLLMVLVLVLLLEVMIDPNNATTTTTATMITAHLRGARSSGVLHAQPQTERIHAQRRERFQVRRHRHVTATAAAMCLR